MSVQDYHLLLCVVSPLPDGLQVKDPEAVLEGAAEGGFVLVEPGVGGIGGRSGRPHLMLLRLPQASARPSLGMIQTV